MCLLAFEKCLQMDNIYSVRIHDKPNAMPQRKLSISDLTSTMYPPKAGKKCWKQYDIFAPSRKISHPMCTRLVPCFHEGATACSLQPVLQRSNKQGVRRSANCVGCAEDFQRVAIAQIKSRYCQHGKRDPRGQQARSTR
jgi:hypothetical protein